MMSTQAALPETILYAGITSQISRTSRAYFINEVWSASGVIAASMPDSFLDIFYADFSIQTEGGATDWGFSPSAFSMHGHPGRRAAAEFVMNGTVVAGGVQIFPGSLPAAYVEVDLGMTITSADTDEFNRALSYALIYFFSGTTTPVRKAAVNFATTTPDTRVRIYLDRSITTGASFVGNTYLIAPIVMRVVAAPLPDPVTGAGGVGHLKSLVGGAVDMDLVLMREFNGYKSRDITNSKYFAIGLTTPIDSWSSTAPLPPQFTGREIGTWLRGAVAIDAFFVPAPAPLNTPGRLRTAVRTEFTPSRKPYETRFELPVIGGNVAVGVELYLIGGVVELRGMQVTGNILPGEKRA